MSICRFQFGGNFGIFGFVMFSAFFKNQEIKERIVRIEYPVIGKIIIKTKLKSGFCYFACIVVRPDCTKCRIARKHGWFRIIGMNRRCKIGNKIFERVEISIGSDEQLVFNDSFVPDFVAGDFFYL